MSHHFNVSLFRFSAMFIALACATPAWSQATGHAHHHHHHAAPASAPANAWKEQSVDIPDVPLVRADGKPIRSRAALSEPQPLLVNFIFTTCTAICPVMTHVFAEVQRELGADAGKVRMVSISIDPEHDTPAKLSAYAASHGAGRQWSFLTGSSAASTAVQRGFGIYRGDKMNHEAVTFFRAAPGEPWTRLDGIAPASDLVKRVRDSLNKGG